MLKHCLLLLLLPCCSSLFGQAKYEKEYRIQPEIVPKMALDYVDRYNFEKKIKWYKEESFTGPSIEAKTKQNKQKFSIEFDTLGQLQDVEIEIAFKDIIPSAQSLICESLNKEFDRFKIRKIQKQYAGHAQDILDFLTEKVADLNLGVEVQFELVLEGKKGTEVQLYEYTFSSDGAIVSKSRIVLRNTDILEY